jgi:hypothetical protein
LVTTAATKVALAEQRSVLRIQTTVFAVSNLVNDLDKLRANSGAAMDFQTSVVFVLIAALAYPLALRQLNRVRR